MTLPVSMLFAQAEPMARKDRGSNYVLVQWIKEGIMVGFVMVLIWKLDKNTRLFAGNSILLSLSRVPGHPMNPKMPANLKSQDAQINLTNRLN